MELDEGIVREKHYAKPSYGPYCKALFWRLLPTMGSKVNQQQSVAFKLRIIKVIEY